MFFGFVSEVSLLLTSAFLVLLLIEVEFDGFKFVVFGFR